VFFVRVFPFEITEAVQHKRVLHGEIRQPEPIRLFTVEFFRYDETHHQQWRGLTLFLQNCLWGAFAIGFPVYSPYRDQVERRIQPSKSNIYFFFSPPKTLLFSPENNQMNGFSRSIFPPFVYVCGSDLNFCFLLL
jgi:hypothetical protein